MALWALAPVAYVALRAAAHGGTFSGAWGLYPGDQALYLGFIRDAGEHVLISNRFDLAPTSHVYLQPMFLLSGLLWRAGVGIQLAYLVWLPAAVATLFAGFRAYVRRMVEPDGWARRLTLLVALFYFSPALALLGWSGLFGHERIQIFTYEVFNAGQLWGYLPAVIAIGLFALVLVGVERLLEPERRTPGRGAAWYAAWTAAGGAVIAWVHPWQGVILVVALALLALWGRLDRRLLPLAAPLAGTALPLAYYYVLGRTDPAFELAQRQAQYPRLPLVALAVLAPIAAIALAGLRGPAVGVGERLLRIWPVAAVAVYLTVSTSPFHALQGVTLPLAILAARGVSRLGASGRLRGRAVALVGGAGIALCTVPGVVHSFYLLHKYLGGVRGPYVLRADESRALAYLDRSGASGGVLARNDMSAAVPALTGRAVWVAHPSWTPHQVERSRAADDLLSGRMPPDQARSLVTASGAAFVLSDCGAHADLSAVLGPGTRVRRFGCAVIYELRRAQ